MQSSAPSLRMHQEGAGRFAERDKIPGK